MSTTRKPESKIRFDTDALRLARLRAGLTQEGLARKLDISMRAYQRWEQGAGVPSGLNLLCVAQLLDVPTSELYVMSEEQAA